MISSAAPRMDAKEARSHAMVLRDESRPSVTTVAPRAASAAAVDLPMPRLAPGTTHTYVDGRRSFMLRSRGTARENLSDGSHSTARHRTASGYGAPRRRCRVSSDARRRCRRAAAHDGDDAVLARVARHDARRIG